MRGTHTDGRPDSVTRSQQTDPQACAHETRRHGPRAFERVTFATEAKMGAIGSDAGHVPNMPAHTHTPDVNSRVHHPSVARTVVNAADVANRDINSGLRRSMRTALIGAQSTPSINALANQNGLCARTRPRREHQNCAKGCPNQSSR